MSSAKFLPRMLSNKAVFLVSKLKPKPVKAYRIAPASCRSESISNIDEVENHIVYLVFESINLQSTNNR